MKNDSMVIDLTLDSDGNEDSLPLAFVSASDLLREKRLAHFKS